MLNEAETEDNSLFVTFLTLVAFQLRGPDLDLQDHDRILKIKIVPMSVYCIWIKSTLKYVLKYTALQIFGMKLIVLIMSEQHQ